MAATGSLPTGARTGTLAKFWDDDRTAIHHDRLRKDIPSLPKVSKEFQTVYGGFETLCYLALQIQKTGSKVVTIRALASAIGILFEDRTNFTGGKIEAVKLTGIEMIIDEEITDRNTVVKTNFEDEEEVTLAELDALMDVDADEMGSYFGVLCLAGVKALNEKNKSAFNDKRRGAAQSTTVGDLKIFVTDSAFLKDAILQKVYASFNSYLPVRSNMIALTVGKLSHVVMGPTLAFTTMFLLLADQGMSALRIVKEALVKHPWIRTEFTEIHAELEVAQEGMASIQKAEPRQRSFLKSIHGSSYVPVSYQSIANLTGICKFVLKETTTTYAHYDGGQVTEAQEARLIQIMTDRGLMRPTKVIEAIVKE